MRDVSAQRGGPLRRSYARMGEGRGSGEGTGNGLLLRLAAGGAGLVGLAGRLARSLAARGGGAGLGRGALGVRLGGGLLDLLDQDDDVAARGLDLRDGALRGVVHGDLDLVADLA